MNNQHNGMNTGFGNFLSLMSDEHIFQVFNHHREISHLPKETVFQELKALVTYGGLSYEQKSLIYKVIEDNYKDLILSNLKDKNAGSNLTPSLLSRLIPADNDHVKIFFVERLQDREQIRVYHGHMNLEFIYVTTFDKDLKPLPVHNSMAGVSVSDLVGLMVEKIKEIDPSFSPAKKDGMHCLNIEVSYSSEEGDRKGMLTSNQLNELISKNKFFNSVKDRVMIVESSNLGDLHKSVGSMLVEISLTPKVFLQNIFGGVWVDKGELAVNIKIERHVTNKLPEVIEENFLKIQLLG